MSQSNTRKRPWLAALLSLLATGLGHLYLRRWRRALGWLLATVGVSALLVDPQVLESLAGGTVTDPLALAPIVVVSGLCVFDAYVLAYAQNIMQRRSRTVDGDLTHCPSCGKELDEELTFCPWCSTELTQPADANGQPSAEHD